jgi:hypothetical protein
MQEEYKIITGFENYEVSNLGNVRNIKTKQILKGGISKGYNLVGLTVAGKKMSKLVHRLVACTFLDNLDNKPCIDHIDNNKLNNNLTNLRYATHTENNQNSSISSRNKSGTKGVCFESCSNTWHAYIRIDKMRINLGFLKNKEDAIQARITRANAAFGVFVNACEKV